MATTREYIDFDHFGPQQVGGRYLCGYWQEEYTVLAITPNTYGGSITVRWADGHTGTHGTAWDHKHDKVIAQP